jgi:serine/threonine protein kinase
MLKLGVAAALATSAWFPVAGALPYFPQDLELLSPETGGAEMLSTAEQLAKKEEVMKFRETLISNVVLTYNFRECPTGYHRVKGNLNSGAGGLDIHLCFKWWSRSTDEVRVTGLEVTTVRQPGPGFELVVDTNTAYLADLNEGAGGADIFLHQKKFSSSIPSTPNCAGINDIKISNDNGCEIAYDTAYTMVRGTTSGVGAGLSGDVNAGAGGSKVFICYRATDRLCELEEILAREDTNCPEGYIGNMWIGCETLQYCPTGTFVSVKKTTTRHPQCEQLCAAGRVTNNNMSKCMADLVKSFSVVDFVPPVDGIYAVGHEYTFGEIAMVTLKKKLELAFEPQGPDGKAVLSFALANAPRNATIDPKSGQIRLIAQGEYNDSMALDVVDSSGARATVKTIALDIRHLDLDNPTLGPNNQKCQNGGVAVDGTGDERFDLKFTCKCSPLFTGDNCETAPNGCGADETLVYWVIGVKPFCQAFVVKSFKRAAILAPPLDGIYAVGHDYTFGEINTPALELSFEGPGGKAGLSFTLANAPLGAMIDPKSGLIRLIAGEPFEGTMTLDLIDSSGARATVERFALDIRYADNYKCSSSCKFPEHGPHHRACAHGTTVDSVEFDANFTCNCADTIFVGANCEVLCEHGVAEGGKACNTGLAGAAASKKGALTSAEWGGLFGAIVALFLVVVAAVQYRAYRERRRPVDFDNQLGQMVDSGELSEDQLNPTLRPREIKRQNVTLLKQVGKGAFGAVWKALLDESKGANGVPEYMVAAKTVLDKDANSDATDDLLNEAAVMAQVAGADGHPNLVSLIGVITSGNPLILLLSYAEHGSVLGVLSTRAAAGEPVDELSKVEMAAQTARGMAHLSEKRFIHRDLAARNVLLASGQSASHMVAKVADFGLSRGSSKQTGGTEQENTEDYYRSQHGVFPVRWTAPESMETLVFTYASDVWSFGIVLVEIFGDGEKPYHSMKSNADVMAHTMSGNLHQKPDGCDDAVYTLMTRCWAFDPSQRPPFAALAAKLERIAAGMSNRTAELATHAVSPSGFEVPLQTDGSAPRAKRRPTADEYQLPVGTPHDLPRAVENSKYWGGADGAVDNEDVEFANGLRLLYEHGDVLPTGGIPVARAQSDFYANSSDAPLERANPTSAWF